MLGFDAEMNGRIGACSFARSRSVVSAWANLGWTCGRMASAR
jgi:hypothetical protein